MPLCRTTKRPRALYLSLACVLGVLMSLAAQAREGMPTVQRVALQNGAAGITPAMPQVVVLGSAPARCAPKVERIGLDGSNLNIELTAPQTACDSQHMLPFGVRIDPAAQTGTPILPGQVYRVRVYANRPGSSSLIAFALLDTTAPTAAAQPENGFWWSTPDVETGPAAAGSGASLEMQDGQLAVSLFGFTDGGAPVWYFGSTRGGARTASVNLVQLANGDPLFAPVGAQPGAQAGPRLELEFLAPSRARAWLVRTDPTGDLQVRGLMLSRTPFSSGPAGSAWSGQWVLVADDKGPPRVFEFAEPSSHDADTFHLTDVANDASLDCRLSSSGPRHPELCTLSLASTPLADFDQVGLDHLRGRGSAGATVKLVRVPR